MRSARSTSVAGYAVLLFLAVLCSTTAVVRGAPTPEPGGADQIAAVSGNFHKWVFNGQLRLRADDFKLPKAGDNIAPDPQNHYLVLHATMANGSKAPYSAFALEASLADADGVTVQNQKTWGVAPDLDLTPGVGGVSNVPPGAAWKLQIPFKVPNDFVPVKLLVVTPDHRFKAFRISISKADLPQ
ncbi:MAG: DUF3426 domain-containing protein [Candidatus Eremiobacteraeota bacterium]|nr:DUF3426 domain-containing protein [Candidatus Eremiobacteraeota bacterium]